MPDQRTCALEGQWAGQDQALKWIDHDPVALESEFVYCTPKKINKKNNNSPEPGACSGERIGVLLQEGGHPGIEKMHWRRLAS